MGFGEIEMFTYRCLEIFPSENIFPSVVNMRLSGRIDLISNVLKSKFSEEESNKMISLLAKVKDLAKKRNLIVHNPIAWKIFEDEEGNITDFKEVIRSLKQEHKFMHFSDLESLHRETIDIIPEIHNEYVKLESLNLCR